MVLVGSVPPGRSPAVHPGISTDAGARQAPDAADLGGTDPPRPQPEAVDHPQVMGSEAMGQMIVWLRQWPGWREELIRRYPGWKWPPRPAGNRQFPLRARQYTPSV